MKRYFALSLIAALVLPLAAFAALKDKPERPLHISEGAQVTLADYLVPGKITIFDFYSTYCPPCMRIAPAVEKLHMTRSDIAVVKVDVNRPGVKGIDWASPVVAQYKLESIPHFKVFGPDGKMIAEDGPDSDKATQLVTSWFK